MVVEQESKVVVVVVEEHELKAGVVEQEPKAGFLLGHWGTLG